MLRHLNNDILPALEKDVWTLSRAHLEHKDRFMRPFGTEINDKMYGTLLMRAHYAMHRLTDYLSGKVDTLPELEGPRYDEGPSAWGFGFENLAQI